MSVFRRKLFITPNRHRQTRTHTHRGFLHPTEAPQSVLERFRFSLSPLEMVALVGKSLPWETENC